MSTDTDTYEYGASSSQPGEQNPRMFVDAYSGWGSWVDQPEVNYSG